jgi:hypothetical protein
MGTEVERTLGRQAASCCKYPAGKADNECGTFLKIALYAPKLPRETAPLIRSLFLAPNALADMLLHYSWMSGLADQPHSSVKWCIQGNALIQALKSISCSIHEAGARMR